MISGRDVITSVCRIFQGNLTRSAEGYSWSERPTGAVTRSWSYIIEESGDCEHPDYRGKSGKL